MAFVLNRTQTLLADAVDAIVVSGERRAPLTDALLGSLWLPPPGDEAADFEQFRSVLSKTPNAQDLAGGSRSRLAQLVECGILLDRRQGFAVYGDLFSDRKRVRNPHAFRELFKPPRFRWLFGRFPAVLDSGSLIFTMAEVQIFLFVALKRPTCAYQRSEVIGPAKLREIRRRYALARRAAEEMAAYVSGRLRGSGG